MDISIIPKEIEEIYVSPVLQQTAYWGKVKENQGCYTKAYDIEVKKKNIHNSSALTAPEEKKRDDLLIVLRPVGNDKTMAYVPYGPTVEPDEENRGVFLEELSECLKPHLPSNCIFIRYDLSWQSPWVHDPNRYNDNGYWMGEPETRVREMRMNFDTSNWNLCKAPTDILPSNTIFLDINQNPESLLKQMKPKTRYNIRLSQRRGVEVKAIDKGDLSIWYDLYRQTSERNNINLHEIGYFESILKTNANNTKSPANIHLLMAMSEETPLAGMFLAISDKRATYLYGASSTFKRNLMATYALQWSAINIAKESGCSEYDLFGISGCPHPSHPMYGLYRFKKGFGGYSYHRQGCWDYPFKAEDYNIYRSVEFNGQGYHVN